MYHNDPIELRPARPEDLPFCLTLDATTTTQEVWQVDARTEDEARTLAFRRLRLPRPVELAYPRDPSFLLSCWQKDDLVLVAIKGETLSGYLDLAITPWQQTAAIHNLVVDRAQRRQGIGRRLLVAARTWASDQGLRVLLAETTTRNLPAIAFFERCGLTLCGYNDRHYPDGEIALFFALNLR